MTSPYTPPPPRRLERSTDDRVVGGVCAGVAQYLNLDPTLVRVLTVVLTLFTGAPLIIYLVALFVMPEARRPGPPPQRRHAVQPPSHAPAPWPRSREEQAVWGTEGAPWEQPQPATPPPPRTPPSDPAPGRSDPF